MEVGDLVRDKRSGQLGFVRWVGLAIASVHLIGTGKRRDFLIDSLEEQADEGR